MTVRGAVAQQQGLDEAKLAKVDRYRESDLSASEKAALALADAYLGSPGDMTDAVRAEVSAQLDAAQIVELLLKLTGFSSDKVMIALGLDFDEIKPVITM